MATNSLLSNNMALLLYSLHATLTPQVKYTSECNKSNGKDYSIALDMVICKKTNSNLFFVYYIVKN